VIELDKPTLTKKRYECVNPECKKITKMIELYGYGSMEIVQCPKCKKKFKAKSMEFSLKSNTEFIFPLNNKIRKKKK